MSETATIALSGGQEALIDACDEERMRMHQWSLRRGGRWRSYASTCLNGELVSMHRFVLDAPQRAPVQHLNGDLLDNRRSNLYRSKTEVRGLFIHNAPHHGKPRLKYRFDCKCRQCPCRKHFPYTVAGLAAATAFAYAHYDTQPQLSLSSS